MKLTYRLGQKNAKFIKRAYRYLSILGRVSRLHLRVEDERTSYFFTPNTRIELHRYLAFFIKEEGTLAWLRQSIQDGDVFVDIGANVGLYSIYAAKLGRRIKVFAFEPHKPNFMSLMRNVVENDLQGTVEPIAMALSDKAEVIKLNYFSLEGGSSRSQLGHSTAKGAEFAPAFEEIVPATTLDDLVRRGVVAAPTHIKIDVDGNERSILIGMAEVLQGPQRPRTIQVELNVGERQQAEVVDLVKAYGYTVKKRHFTRKGKRALARGESAENIAHNVIFEFPTGA